jgi:hypothetical protein
MAKKKAQGLAGEAVAKPFGDTKPTKEDLLRTASEQHKGESPETLLSFKVYPDKVAIVISTGQKYEYSYAELLKRLDRPK